MRTIKLNDGRVIEYSDERFAQVLDQARYFGPSSPKFEAILVEAGELKRPATDRAEAPKIVKRTRRKRTKKE
jgi:hypothetical protein